MKQGIHIQVTDSKKLDSSYLSEEKGFADYIFPVNIEPLSNKLMQMRGLQHKTWGNSRQQDVYPVRGVQHPSFPLQSPGFKFCVSVTSDNNLWQHATCL